MRGRLEILAGRLQLATIIWQNEEVTRTSIVSARRARGYMYFPITLVPERPAVDGSSDVVVAPGLSGQVKAYQANEINKAGIKGLRWEQGLPK